MKLPNAAEAVVPERKITHYLLSRIHEEGAAKARFFLRFGFTKDQWEIMASALLAHAREHEVTKTVPSSFGLKYVIEGTLWTPDGRNPAVRSVWMINHGATNPRFVTAYKLEE